MGVDRRAFLLLAAALSFAFASSSCASNAGDEGLKLNPPDAGAADPSAIYVGTVDKSDIRVGLVVLTGKGALFFCGGPTTLGSTKWFRGAVGADSISLDKDGAAARGTFSATKASGTMTPAQGQPLTWSVTRVAEGSVAGLYDAKDTGIAGVVVASSDFAQGAYIDMALKVSQIIVIQPIRVLDFGLTVTVDTRQIVVHRVVPQ